MENEGWAHVFRMAKGEPSTGWVTNKFTGKSKKVKITPSAETQLTAIKLLAEYGYGKPKASFDLTSGGKSITDFILEALGDTSSLPEQGVK